MFTAIKHFMPITLWGMMSLFISIMLTINVHYPSLMLLLLLLHYHMNFGLKRQSLKLDLYVVMKNWFIYLQLLIGSTLLCMPGDILPITSASVHNLRDFNQPVCLFRGSCGMTGSDYLQE